MEAKSSLPCLQDPSTRTYREPEESIPCLYLLKIHYYYYFYY